MSWQGCRRGGWPLAALLVVACALPLGTPSSAMAKEQLREFVEALRRRQMHDVAIEYLEHARTSPLIDDETRKLIPYEEGRTLVDQARTLRDINERMRRLDEATKRFEEFVQAYPDHPLAGAANRELGNVEVERGRTKLELAKRPSQAAKKEQLRAEALEHFKKAKDVFAYAEQRYEAELARFPKLIDQRDRKQIEARRQARLNLIEAQMLSALVLYEMAQAHEEGSAQRKQLLTEAAERFKSLYEQYRLKVAGLSARLYQARCLQELGDLVMALTYYEELLAQDTKVPVLRDLASKALRQAMQCWLDESQKKYDRAIEEGEKWLREAAPHEASSPVGQDIRWQTALAYEKRAETQEDEAARARDLAAAAKQAQQLARQPGQYQRRARQMVARLRNIEGDQPPTTFAEARDLAKSKLDQLQVLAGRIRIAQTTGRGKEDLEKLKAQVVQLREEALKLFRLALALRDDQTDLEQVNQTRYFLAYLYYQRGAYYDAAVLGEFLARRYPDSAAARPAAEIAVAAYLKAYNESAPETRDFETERLADLAQYLAEKWPEQPQARRAWLILGELANRAGDLDRAIEYFAKIPDDAPERSEADLKAGRALWAAYISASQGGDGQQRPPQKELDQRLRDAERLLTRGIEALRKKIAEKKATPDRQLAEAELTLARLYVETSRPKKALELLERPGDGVLALVEGGKVAGSPRLALETYKTALRAYVLTQQLGKAQATMAKLDKTAKRTGGDQASLTRVYVDLGHELQQQVDRLREQKKQKQLKTVLKSFELFLEKIGSRDQGNTFSTLRWVADTYSRLAEGLGNDSSQKARAKELYAKAVNVYDKILKRSRTQPGFAPKGADDVIKIAKAKALRGRGQYKDALLLIVDVLADNPKTLQAQIEAAETYQAWAAENPKLYMRAILGRSVKRGGKQIEIWGWARLANLVQRHAKYRSIYHLARYRVAQCRYALAMQQTKAEQVETLKKAQRDIVVTARLDPAMGGPEWFGRYDALLKKIQRSLGQKTNGLSAIINQTTSRTSRTRSG